MATFTSNKTTANGQSNGLTAGGDIIAKSLHEGVNVASATYTVTATLSAGDVIQMVNVPKGAQVVGMVLTATDLDTGTSMTLDVGDGIDPNRYVNASTIGQAGGALVGPNVNTALSYVYTAADSIDITVSAFDGTGSASGTIKLDVHFLAESE